MCEQLSSCAATPSALTVRQPAVVPTPSSDFRAHARACQESGFALAWPRRTSEPTATCPLI
eukprot:6172709-Pleurochrysis_carterae.AAC.2